MEGSTNLLVMYFSWWYGHAYRHLLTYIRAAYIFITDLFSVKISMKTLFAPWKRDQISYESLSLQQKFQAFTLNVASRFVGFIVKITTLFCYLVAVAVVSLISIVIIVAWPLYPLIAILLVYTGVKLIL
jgi:hypothetical protein